MIGSESLKYNFSKKKFMVPDLETSCLNLAMGYNRPWQVSWLICQGTEIIKKNNYYLRWPDFYISPGAAAATRFDPRNIELYGQDPKEILDLFDKDLYNEEYIIVGQNLLNFDVYIHSMWRENFGNSIDYSYIDRIIDVRALAVCWKLGLKFKETEDFLAHQEQPLVYMLEQCLFIPLYIISI